jgi:RNA polymerase sigma-70 factor (ECF subfamily)
MDSTPDKQLLDQVLHGSPEALAKLLEQFRPYLLLLADRHLDEGLRAKGGASDLVQDTCLAACEDLASFRGHNLRQLQAWLSRILLDRLAQFTRRYRDTKKRSVRFEASLERLLHCPRLDPHLID